MPRTSTIRYFESRKGYYTQYHGKQHCLSAGPKDEPDGPTYKAAVKKFAELMHADEVERAEDNNLVISVLDRYAWHLRQSGRERTLTLYLQYTQHAISAFGRLKIKELKPYHVQTWLHKMTEVRGRYKGRDCKWGQTTQEMALSLLRAAFNWAVRQKIITRSPIEKGSIEIKGAKARGRDFVLDDATLAKLLATKRPHLATVLRALAGTGARPGEMYHVEAYHYRPDLAAFVFRWNADRGYIWKNAKKTEKDRIIFLTPDLQTLAESLVAKHPTGYLFRTQGGLQWTHHLMNSCLGRACKTLNIKQRVIPYSFRHTYATNMLRAGMSPKVLADLLGTSLLMIEKHYGHLDADLHALRSIFLRFNHPDGKSGTLPSAEAPGEA